MCQAGWIEEMLGSRIAGVDSRRHRLAPDTGSPQHEVGLSTLSDTTGRARPHRGNRASARD